MEGTRDEALGVDIVDFHDAVSGNRQTRAIPRSRKVLGIYPERPYLAKGLPIMNCNGSLGPHEKVFRSGNDDRAVEILV